MITHNMEHAIEYGNRLVMLYHGKIVVDVRGEEKKNLTVAELMDLFHKNSGQVSMTMLGTRLTNKKETIPKFRFWVVFS